MGKEDIYKIVADREWRASLISSFYGDIECIEIAVIDAFNKELKGRSWKYTPERKRFFYIQCSFAECYGSESGIYFDDIIDSMYRAREERRTCKVQCSGKGDRGLHYSCDNYVVLDITIRYVGARK